MEFTKFPVYIPNSVTDLRTNGLLCFTYYRTSSSTSGYGSVSNGVVYPYTVGVPNARRIRGICDSSLYPSVRLYTGYSFGSSFDSDGILSSISYNGNVYNILGRNTGVSSWITIDDFVPAFNNDREAVEYYFGSYPITIPITYNAIGCTLEGPEEADPSDEVSVIVTPESGCIIRDPTQGKGISVYDKNGYIPFTYSDGNLTFTVPSS